MFIKVSSFKEEIMLRRATILICTGLLLANVYGCVALVAGAAGGAGAAVWLSGKLSQIVNANFDQTIATTKRALKSFDLPIKKETVESPVATFRSENKDGKEIWVDIKKVTDTTTKVEVRVGGVRPNKEVSTKILKRIEEYL